MNCINSKSSFIATYAELKRRVELRQALAQIKINAQKMSLQLQAISDPAKTMTR